MIRYLLMICLALGLGLGGLAFTQSACASKKMSCHSTAPSSCCCKKKQARICSCDHRTSSQPALLNNNADHEPFLVAVLLSQLVILSLLLGRWLPTRSFFCSTEGRARGPTSLGLSAFQIALPPPV